MSYSTSEAIKPFWAENSGFMTGRDPLGIQNSSITVYGRLLPGMTNLTQRLRYYGIYSWLLNEYDKLDVPKEEKTIEHQYNFIRRAELIIAFMMVNEFPSEKSVIGSDFANRYNPNLLVNNYYNVANGADKSKQKKEGDLYWKFSSGALGQYYAGTLTSLNIIEVCNKFFHIQNQGRQLAKAFEESVPADERRLFLSLIKSGQISKDDLELIREFSLSLIPEQSVEWCNYRDLLLADDGPNFKTSDGESASKRRETIGLYLNYKINKCDNIKFDEWMYRSLTKNTPTNTASFGWFYYYINEAIHFSIETIFWSMLEHLDGRIIPIQTFLKELKDIILEQSCKHLGLDSEDNFEYAIELIYEYYSLLELDLVDHVRELESLSKSTNNYDQALGKAILLLTLIYKFTEGCQKEIQDFENLNLINRQKGNVTENISIYLRRNFEKSYSSSIESILRNLINDHITTAYRKMGNGEVSLLKFNIEDNVIAHIETMSPKHTTPRLHTLHNFLRDLNLINDTGSPTDSGKELLNQLREEYVGI